MQEISENKPIDSREAYGSDNQPQKTADGITITGGDIAIRKIPRQPGAARHPAECLPHCSDGLLVS
jgi:hypothetical protein